MDDLPLQRAVKHAGSQTRLAERVGVSQQVISKWLAKEAKGDRRAVPAELAKPIEEATRGEVTRHELRPDIFGEPSGEDAAA